LQGRSRPNGRDLFFGEQCAAGMAQGKRAKVRRATMARTCIRCHQALQRGRRFSVDSRIRVGPPASTARPVTFPRASVHTGGAYQSPAR
ncbi:MAG TPA: hypothetical protein VK689_11995, partial [Armatimonadota bacterium]|nr:hypothetical protein [Armatimonadota bacterium]